MYLIYGDTHKEPYGCDICAFGIATTPEKAEIIRRKAEKKARCVEVIEIGKDRYLKVYLGGYCE